MLALNLRMRSGALGREVLFPNQYAWYLLACALDIMLTVTILEHLHGREVNAVAQRAIELGGHWGLIGLKFASAVLVVSICEYVGRRKRRVGERVAGLAVAISAAPCVLALAQIALLSAAGEWPPLS